MSSQYETPKPAPNPAAGVLICGALLLSGAGLLAGLGPLALLHLVHLFLLRARAEREARRRAAQYWVDTTRQYFYHFNHDLGRPLRRILGKERELRDLLAEQRIAAPPEVHRLLDEIETQTPAFRPMLGNLHALIELETPEPTPELWPVEPAEIANKIVLRYQAAAAEQGKDLVWIPESQEPSIIASNGHALEHILANLVDNALRHAAGYVEVALTREENALTITVEGDGPGIPERYQPYIFDRGWTPETARREERTSSGLGLYIARTLAEQYGGRLTVNSAAAPDPEQHTAFVLTLPAGPPPAGTAAGQKSK